MLPSRGRRVPGPRFDLEAFQAEVRAGNFHVYKTRALNLVVHLLSCSEKRARRFVQESVLLLTQEDFAHTIELPNGQAHDVYGKVITGEGWYLKIEININDQQPGIVSCHPAEHDLRTLRGVVPRGRRWK